MPGWLPIGVTEDDSSYNGPLSTYVEWHSATIGAGLTLAGVVAFLFVGREAAAPFVVLWLRLSHYALTGRRLELAGRLELGLLSKYLGQIREEPQYYLGASLLVLAASGAVLLGGVLA